MTFLGTPCGKAHFSGRVSCAKPTYWLNLNFFSNLTDPHATQLYFDDTGDFM